MTINSLFSMGGYGLYVWPAYSITLCVLAINVFAAFREKGRIKKTVQQHILWVEKEAQERNL